MIDDYQDIETEYKKLIKISEDKIQNFNYISHKIDAFNYGLENLKNCITSVPDLSDTPFNFLDDILNNFAKMLEKNASLIKNLITNQINNIIKSFKIVIDENLKRLKDIKYNLSNEKMNLIDKTDKYYNFMNINQNDINNKVKRRNTKTKNTININFDEEDDIKYDYAIKGNYEQLYKYELDKMNEIIDENNKNYNDIYVELSAINGSSIIMIKERLIEFAGIIKNLGEILGLLSFELINKLENSEELNKDNIMQKLNEKKQVKEIRFKKEIIEINDKKKRKLTYNKKNFEINSKDKINDSIIPYNKDEIIYKEKYINDMIKRIIEDKEEIKSKDISNLLNILKINYTGKNYSKIFLDKIDNNINNNILFIKNKKNFIHLSNIINDICLNDKNNLNIFYLISDISQMIAYKKTFLYYNLTKKNQYFKTKTLWINLINAIITVKINRFIKDILENKEPKNKNHKKTDNKEEKEKEEEKDKNDNLKRFLKKKNIYKSIKDYKKLNKTQKQDLENFTKKNLLLTLSEIVQKMCLFEVNAKIIEEIIEDYNKELYLDNKRELYLKNKIIMNSFVKKGNSFINDKKNLTINNNIIILTFASNYLNVNELPNLFKLNKRIYKILNKNIILNLLSNSNIPIEKTLIFWNQLLKIEEIKKVYVYKGIKSGINLSIYQDQIKKGTKQLKNMDVIQQDLKRTYFIQNNLNNYDSIKSILNCFLITFPQIGYCQGMNFVVSFLYQLLDEDEEKTFYYLCGLELNTNYHEIFEDDFVTLTIFFNVFDNILKILSPDIYYKFKSNLILPNSYSSTWFITLFTEFILIFDKKNPPLLAIFIFNKFIIEGWRAIFNCGFMLLELCHDKIMGLGKDKLMNYIMNILDEEKLFDNQNYEKCKNIYIKNEKVINNYFLDKLIYNSNFDYYNNK